MKRNTFLSLLLLPSFMFTGCTIIDDFFGKDIQEQLTLVYIDLSSSQDSLSVTQMLNKIEKIYTHQPKEYTTRFIVRLIDKDNSIEPLFDYTLEPAGERVLSKEKYNASLETSSKQLCDTILNYYQEVIPRKKRYNESCICNSLDNSPKYLTDLDEETCKVQVIIFSDMFEECPENSSFMKKDFYMCGYRSRVKSLEELKNTIQQNYSPKRSLSDYVKPENLYFILTESENYNEQSSRCLNANEVEELWEVLFKKMGYSEKEILGSKDASGIWYSGEVPDRLLRLNE